MTVDLEKIIDDLVYRKKNLDLDSAEYQFIDRVLTGLRYSYEDAGGIIEDLDTFGWDATCSDARPALHHIGPLHEASMLAALLPLAVVIGQRMPLNPFRRQR
jgi:hypothetical protein